MKIILSIILCFIITACDNSDFLNSKINKNNDNTNNDNTKGHYSNINRDNKYNILHDRNYIIYMEKNNEHVVETLDLNLGLARQQSKEVINMTLGQIKELIENDNNMEDVIGEWQLDFCEGNMYCSKNSLQIAIPKGKIPKIWRYEHIDCKLINKKIFKKEYIYNIICSAVNYSNNLRSKFSYSKRLGVTKYKIECDGCYREEYVLLSNKGLFAKNGI